MTGSENSWSVDDLIRIMEEQQTELEESERQIDSLSTQIRELSSDNSKMQNQIQRLSYENSELKSSLQQKSDEIVNLNEQIENLSDSDRQLKEAEDKLNQCQQLGQKLEQKEKDIKSREDTADKRIMEYNKMIDAAEKDSQKLAKDKKVFRSLVEKSAMHLYEKERGKLHAEYLARKLLLSGYVAWITFLLLFVTVLSAIRQKVFWGDLTAFFETLKHGILIPADKIDHLSRQTADMAKGMEQPILSVVLWWLSRAGIPILAIIPVIVIIAILIKRYGRDLWKKGINRWNCSLSAMILCLFVFCGDYVKVIFHFNLVLIWLILDSFLIGITWYRYVCDEYRGRK